MFDRCATAALVLTIAATGCGNNPGVPFVGPPATLSPSPMPAATPVGATPTPTPTVTPVGSTPTPTPTATPVGSTPTPTPTATPAGATPTPTPTATPAPTATPTPTPSATPTPTATPAPTATPTPTPTPTPVPVVPAPTSLAFTALGASNAQNVSVSESGYGGTFSETDSCAGIATIAAASPTFTVTPIAVGTCSITIFDISQRMVTVPVTVTTSGLVVQKKGVHS
jgi:outer membrane biosynthesis protein TonB